MRIILLLGILTLLGFKDNSVPTNPSFEEQFQIFRDLEFELNEGTDKTDLARWEEQEFLDEPFSLMYLTFGQTLEREPWTPLSDKCWDFDTEAIYDNGSYIEIIKNLERITRGELVFEDVKDYVNIEEKKAWVSFSLGSENYKWNLKIDDDWVDTDLFIKIVELTDKVKSKGRYTYFDAKGQNSVIGYETLESLRGIRYKTGLKIEWLNKNLEKTIEYRY
ncbi:MAG: hypothetical protein CVV25_01890 [Ignavibacteriae bacterium HGW-Ignavibacteriae-4]|jgi:hypothetical protein|nr:MAG: hypothetical protein CVV25_01890 [Ignavibacteriae bacterium HGW-Ignavibacteriae-4]